MSVLIKGIAMPDGAECWNCPCLDGEDGNCNALERIVYAGKRPSDCPLIEIPDHGDLIDREELKHGFCVECTLYPDNCLKEDCDWGSIYHIDHAPVVIPAERKQR